MNIILLPTMYTNASEGEDEDGGGGHGKRTKELEIGKGGRYATPFDAIKNTPMKGDGKKAMEEIGDMVETCPLQGKRLWCESTRGRGEGELLAVPCSSWKNRR